MKPVKNSFCKLGTWFELSVMFRIQYWKRKINKLEFNEIIILEIASVGIWFWTKFNKNNLLMISFKKIKKQDTDFFQTVLFMKGFVTLFKVILLHYILRISSKAWNLNFQSEFCTSEFNKAVLWLIGNQNERKKLRRIISNLNIHIWIENCVIKCDLHDPLLLLIYLCNCITT